MKLELLLPFLLLASVSDATKYFEERFLDGEGWKNRWIQSKANSNLGEWRLTSGKWQAPDSLGKEKKGLQTSQDARFYALSAHLKSPFSNRDKTLVVQFSVKHEQTIDCGGGYIKLLPASLKSEEFNGDSQYYIMFGPDICGATKRVHVILHYKGENHQFKKEISAKSDDLTHFYTLVIKPDNTYKVLIDGKEEAAGSLFDDWKLLPPKKIPDPKASKPADWVDEPKIVDPNDKKPADWDSIPEKIVDPEAKKPEDWDDEMDGDWVAPTISNPDYKGEWVPRKIDNPAYKGPWIHPEIDNPDYFEDKTVYAYDNIGALGFDLWQVKSGSIFDNILVTDDESEASKVIEETYSKYHKAEESARDASKSDNKPLDTTKLSFDDENLGDKAEEMDAVDDEHEEL